MTTQTLPVPDLMLSEMTDGWFRSAAFLWMKANHDTLVQALGKKRISWERVCDWFAQLGLTDRSGKTPTRRNARETWYTVRKVVAREKADRDAARLEAQHLEAEREAQREQARIDALARKQAQAAEKADIRQKMAQAEQELQARQLAQARRNSPSVLYPQGYETPAPLAQTFAPAVANVAAAPVVPQDNTTDGDQPRVRIGEVAHFVQMKTQAPRYGHERDIPLPPPYVGPRPAGMPEDLPLEALMPLDASGRDENGNYDFLQMPGLPRRSFYDNKRIWALDCLPMIEAIPPRERPPALKSMRVWLTMVLGQ